MKFFILVLTLITLRVYLLEYPNLIDPTESRYAVVAQHMVDAKNWLTPMLPVKGEFSPYLGKPPFHFWLTALSYSAFGVDEWSSRLPSLLGALFILVILYNWVKVQFSKEIALNSALILASSGMFFFVSGASVTDMTLTALITGSVIILFSHRANPIFPYLGALLAGLAFLTKGPVALVLIGTPILLSSIFFKLSLKGFPFLGAFALFGIVTIPWFALNEISNPGFLKYFFWNENIARFLIKDYGDLYGTGHVHTRGMAWMMGFLGFLPWSPILIYALIRYRRVERWSRTHLFLVTWALTPFVFFSFARQLHALYLLPTLPPLAVLSALLFQHIKFPKLKTLIMIILALTIITTGMVLKPSYQIVVPVLTTLIIFVVANRVLRENINGLSIKLLCLYMLFISALSPYISERRSSEDALKFIANSYHEPTVGISSNNSYSFYWLSSAWRKELFKPVKIVFLDTNNPVHADLIVSKNKSPESSPELNFIRKIGEWSIFSK